MQTHRQVGRMLLAAAACWWAGRPATAQAPPAELRDAIDFARDIQPIFAQHCYRCHGAEKQEAGLRLNSRASALAGGDSGEKAIVPGQPEQSRLVQLASGKDPDLTMPPEGEPLAPHELDLLVHWIRAGAAWPEEADGGDAGPAHWAWKKPVRPALPKVSRTDWPRNAIDYFVLARLESEGLGPAAEADRRTLVRRVYLDLVGLPPSPQDVDAFVNEPRLDAYERLVDRLLADPAYGERWARMWLDLARYADSKGYGSDPLRTIWRYRDWVIEAFNRNLPYDRFTIEQLAGDLLPNPTGDQLLATAFHRNTMSNDEGGTDDEEFRVAAVKDRVETTMQVWMGLTAGCAKCHSHKFDPITQREYYQLFALFNQTQDADRGDEEPRLVRPTPAQQLEIDRLKRDIARLQHELDTPTPELAAAEAKWEEAVAALTGQWVVLEATEASAANGTSIQKLPDHSLLAGGASPETDTYTVVTHTDLQGITALRLEVLPHETLPQNGPGREPTSGAFVLADLGVTAAGPDSTPIRGRHVRIEIPGQQKILSLAEVQVLEGASNIALAGQAGQSSTDYDGQAQRAIDNDTNGHYFEANSTTHTKLEDNPWWEIDLGRLAEVNRVAVWNRTDGDVRARLGNFRVSVLDEARRTVWQTEVAEPPNPSVEIEVAGPAQVALERPTADFSQEGFPVSGAIDGQAGADSGWAVEPEFGKPHTSVFQTAEPVGFEGGTTLSFSLVQSRGGGQTIGRLRLSATTAAPPPVELPGRTSDVLAVAATNRTADEQAELARYYRSIAPALQGLRDQLAGLEGQLKALEEQVPATPVLRELAADQRRATHVMIKGNFLTPSDAVEPAAPAAFHPLPAGAAPDRLGLAMWLVADDNPLAARVAVNRFWAQLFGVGLVETEEDFGTQGTPPSHPELLDWLAVEFQQGPRGALVPAAVGAEGSARAPPHPLSWDAKALLRRIVTSATYRQSSRAAPELVELDQANRLLARGPRARLEAEMVRDQALALSGLLSRKMGGPSVYPPQPPGLWRAAFNGDRTWPTSTGPDRYRRGLYTFWRRTVPYPSMAAFDAPSREICTMRRIPTNTPLQAFVTLNDPVYVEAAQALARRIVGEGGTSVEDRAAYGLRLCLARAPREEQVRELVALYLSQLEYYRQDAAAAEQLATDPFGPLPAGMDAGELAAWTVVGNVLLNLDGVLSKR